tara:strand:- start:476 stop:682 length:207 start_codon:yes stop_codon:yes gene_type:complete
MEVTSATIVALLEGGAFLIGAALRAQKGALSAAEAEAILTHLGQEGASLRAAIDAALAAQRQADRQAR